MDKNQTELNLKEAFWTLYSKKPINKITVKEITDLAGYNRGTFYLYFKDTYEILETIKAELLDVVRGVIENLIKIDDKNNISIHMNALIEISQQYVKYTNVLFNDYDFVSKLKEIIRPLISQWILNEQSLNNIQYDFIMEFYLSGLLSIIAKWLNNPQSMNIEEFADFIIHFLFQDHQ